MKNINRKKSIILKIENIFFLLNYTFNKNYRSKENYYSKRFLISLKKIKPELRLLLKLKI